MAAAGSEQLHRRQQMRISWEAWSASKAEWRQRQLEHFEQVPPPPPACTASPCIHSLEFHAVSACARALVGKLSVCHCFVQL
jgi:hypothetical protein